MIRIEESYQNDGYFYVNFISGEKSHSLAWASPDIKEVRAVAELIKEACSGKIEYGEKRVCRCGKCGGHMTVAIDKPNLDPKCRVCGSFKSTSNVATT